MYRTNTGRGRLGGRVSQFQYSSHTNGGVDNMEPTGNNPLPQLAAQPNPDVSCHPHPKHEAAATIMPPIPNYHQSFEAYASQQSRDVLQLFPSAASPNVAVASNQNQSASPSIAAKRPANSRRSAKTKADRDPLAIDVSEKRLHERGIEGKSRAKKKGNVSKLTDAYLKLPEEYRQTLDRRVCDQEGKKTQNLAQADVFLRVASALEDLNRMLLSGASTAPDEMGPREQEDPMPIDELAILNLNMDVIDPVPAFPDPSFSFFDDPNLWMHGPVGGFDDEIE